MWPSFGVCIPTNKCGHPTVCNADRYRWVGEIAKEGGAKKESQYLVSYICKLRRRVRKVPQIDRDIGDKGGTIQRLSRVSPKEEEFFVHFVGCRFLGVPFTLHLWSLGLKIC